MRFGEKLRALRREKGLTQAELAKLAGVGLKTITNYEKGTTYPQNREVYGILARILGCDADYLHNEGDDFIAMAGQEYGYRGKKGAERLLKEIRGAFSGGEMAEEDMDELMLAIQEAYIDAKKRNKKLTHRFHRITLLHLANILHVLVRNLHNRNIIYTYFIFLY